VVAVAVAVFLAARAPAVVGGAAGAVGAASVVVAAVVAGAAAAGTDAMAAGYHGWRISSDEQPQCTMPRVGVAALAAHRGHAPGCHECTDAAGARSRVISNPLQLEGEARTAFDITACGSAGQQRQFPAINRTLQAIVLWPRRNSASHAGVDALNRRRAHRMLEAQH